MTKTVFQSALQGTPDFIRAGVTARTIPWGAFFIAMAAGDPARRGGGGREMAHAAQEALDLDDEPRRAHPTPTPGPEIQAEATGQA